jgi:hypothetical protein
MVPNSCGGSSLILVIKKTCQTLYSHSPLLFHTTSPPNPRLHTYTGLVFSCRMYLSAIRHHAPLNLKIQKSSCYQARSCAVRDRQKYVSGRTSSTCLGTSWPATPLNLTRTTMCDKTLHCDQSFNHNILTNLDQSDKSQASPRCCLSLHTPNGLIPMSSIIRIQAPRRGGVRW